MQAQLDGIDFERTGMFSRAVKKVIVDPLANYMPSGLLRAALRFGKSRLAAANWADPGGWLSMVISYDGQCPQIADKVLARAGAMAKALRNRRRLAGRLIAGLIDQSPADPVHVLCLGAGPGRIILDALTSSQRNARATLVDLRSDAFEYGRQLARSHGVEHRVEFIQGDVRNVETMLQSPPDVLKLIGILEYLDDAAIEGIASAVAKVMKPGSHVIFNSLSKAHGTDRFFRRVFGLHMTHRTPEQLEALLAKHSFGEFRRFDEPMCVYTVVVGRRL